MNFQGNFNKVSAVDISPLKDLVLQLTPQHWAGDTTRQNRYEVHQDTRMIGLVYDYDFRHTNPTRLPAMQVFGPVMQPILALIANHYESLPEAKVLLKDYGHGHFIRASLVRLVAGGKIAPHQDKNFSLAHSHRMHIPVVTSEKVLFTVGNETINMNEGEIIEINNRRIHSVRNDGKEGRVHLILDWVTPDEPCCCSAKTHPGVPCSPRACVESDRLKILCNCFPEDQSAIIADSAEADSRIRRMQAPQAQMDLRDAAERATSAFSATAIKAVLKDPVIIVSAPRSGSNLLFEQLARFPGFWTIGGESHVILQEFPRLRAENPEFDSGNLGEEHADPETRRLLRSCFLYLLRDHQGEPYLDRPDSRRPATVCLLEKTPRNALNIPFLLKVFPQARFVYLHRDPRQTIASLIEAWTLGLQAGSFVTFPSLPGWDRPAWCFLLPQGWRKMRGRSLAEIAAFQWSASNKAIMEGLAPLPAERWTTLTYRAFIADPGKSLTGLSRFAGIEAADVQLNGGALPLSRTTLTPPHPDKWKKYEHELEALWPDLSETAGKIERFCEGHGDPR